MSTVALPNKVTGVYWPNWNGPPLQDIPASYNLIYAAFAWGDGKKGGGVVFHPDDGSGVSPAQFKAGIGAAHRKGQKVILSIGGANDMGIHLQTAEHVTELVDDVAGLVLYYGFDGIDWDLEHLSNISVGALLSATRKLKKEWGRDFIIAAAPAPSATLYKAFAGMAGNNLNFFAMQFYGYPATDKQRIAEIQSRITEMVEVYKVPPGKLGIGCSNYDADMKLVSSPSVYLKAYQQAVAKYPSLRGAMVWDAALDAEHDWPFAKTVAAAIRGTA